MSPPIRSSIISDDPLYQEAKRIYQAQVANGHTPGQVIGIAHYMRVIVDADIREIERKERYKSMLVEANNHLIELREAGVGQ